MTRDQELLVENNINLVGYFISIWYKNLLGNEDLYQIACVGLVKAATTWDESKGSFSKYVGLRIKSEISHYFQNASRLKRKGEDYNLSLDQEIGDESGLTYKDIIPDEDFSEALINKEVQDQYIRLALDKLKERDRRIFLLYHIHKLKHREISELEGISKERVRQIVKRSEELLREELEGVLE